LRKGEIIKPKAEGVPIGLLEDRQYEEIEFMAEIGDTILFFSDGVEDQLNAREEDYSRLRVIRMLKKHGAESPAAFAKAIFADLDAFREGTPITDDQSIVVMRVC
jgi:sigma-B regulation protein RsbU (phosphoserine phosphatase)